MLAAGVLIWLLWPGREMPFNSLLPALLRRDVTWQAMQARNMASRHGPQLSTI